MIKVQVSYFHAQVYNQTLFWVDLYDFLMKAFYLSPDVEMPFT